MRRFPAGRDEGQNTLEHMGLAAVIAVVVVLALGSGPALRDLAGGFGGAVCRTVAAVGGGGGCAGSLPPEARPNGYYEPKSCLVSSSTNKYGAMGAVAVVTIGKEVAFVTQRMSDGAVHVTAVDADSVGLETGIGAGVNFGKTFRLGAEANIGGGVTASYGDTWVFQTPEDAERFIGDIKKQAGIDAAKDVPVFGFGADIYDAVAGPDLPPPTITRLEASGRIGADAGGGLMLGRETRDSGQPEEGSWEAGPNLNAGVRIGGSGKIVVEHDHEKNTVSKTYALAGEGAASAQVPTESVGATGKRSGAMKITRREDGTLVGIQFVQTTVVNGEATVITTDLPIRDAGQRRVAERWLASHNDGGTTLKLTWDDMAPTAEPAPDAADFAHLMYDEGQVTRAHYTRIVDPVAFGAEVKLGLQLGLNVYHENATQNLVSAQYLGAPRGGRRSYVPYAECHG